ncbi:MAG: tail fiber domain-containing protein, partial [Chloroflexota bacterium]
MPVESIPFGLQRLDPNVQTWNFNITHDGDLEVRSDSLEGGATRMLLKDSGAGEGNVGIGTRFPSNKLHVVGNIFATGLISSGSDEQFKLDIEPLQQSLAKVLDLKPIFYRGNFEEFPDKISEGPHIGFIGQDVVELIPEVVFNDDDG